MDLRTKKLLPFQQDRRIFHWCPICGAPMFEAERLIENKCQFVWFECSAKGCQGQWLDKKNVAGERARRSTQRA
jgi:hypothetical protein